MLASSEGAYKGFLNAMTLDSFHLHHKGEILGFGLCQRLWHSEVSDPVQSSGDPKTVFLSVTN